MPTAMLLQNTLAKNPVKILTNVTEATAAVGEGGPKKLKKNKAPTAQIEPHQFSYPFFFQTTTTQRAKKSNTWTRIGIALPMKRSAIWTKSTATSSLITARRRDANGIKDSMHRLVGHDGLSEGDAIVAGCQVTAWTEGDSTE
ncbi:uncharacterized protein BCR38DRAFT_429757 [Pseudomassariella vexata]|uniref:Uncharacterized protein n=1 Tax=Pseudomassariella vexata TaxID=1141098 RepID=A0A1Y2E3Y4_9PEZI|nr:uncharacterized protein BCR38DRAFT_429757 [Pseudomassariella vexata]ORY66270.1 hypothetical protein BCR38DRAFT_429757 [Pseudomassariella vexata]